MRAAAYLLGLALLATSALPALAQNPATPSSGTPPAASDTAAAPAAKSHTRNTPDIGREEYIQKAVERAKHNAGKRFDKMDTNHDGTLTADERRAARAARRAASSPD